MALVTVLDQADYCGTPMPRKVDYSYQQLNRPPHEYSFVHTILSVSMARDNIQPSLCGTRTVGEPEYA